MEPRWFRIFIYIAGACRLVNLRRLPLSLREASRRQLHVMPASDTFFRALFDAPALSTVFSGEPWGSLRRVVQSFGSGLLTDG